MRCLVTPFVRFLRYDRSGLGKSESYPHPQTAITAETGAQELDALLKNMNLTPLFIMVAHSWGSILTQEFLHMGKADVMGMVFVNANHETTFEHPEDLPYPCFQAVQAGIDP